jgi:two-component system chemotaxis response regulator CheB
MPPIPLVVVGASAGGVQALRQFLPSLPPDLPAAVAIVLHRVPAEAGDRLAQLLSRTSRVPVDGVRDGETIRPARAYVAPAGVHLEVSGAEFRLSAGPRENNSRPAIDILFRTAAAAHGRKVIGVLLSGVLDDGTAGLAAIKAAGGYTIVQEPRDALFGDMPKNAIANAKVDAVCTASEMGPMVVKALARLALAAGPRRTAAESDPSARSCPDCGGVLCEREERDREDGELEQSLWTAVRALQERAGMSELMARRLRKRNLEGAAQRLELQARVARERAAMRAALTDAVSRHEAVEGNGIGTDVASPASG